MDNDLDYLEIQELWDEQNELKNELEYLQESYYKNGDMKISMREIEIYDRLDEIQERLDLLDF